MSLGIKLRIGGTMEQPPLSFNMTIMPHDGKEWEQQRVLFNGQSEVWSSKSSTHH